MPAGEFRPNLYVLAVGVSRYQDPAFNLSFADEDARGIAAAFRGQTRLFGEVKTKVLTDAQATRGNVLDAFDWIESEVTQRDLALVFVAGHGINDERDNYWFLPHDGNPEKLRRTSIDWPDFNAMLEELPGKTLLLVDTCKSGNVTGSRRFRGISNADATQALHDLIRTEAGVVAMSASSGGELSVESEKWGHGAFTKALLDGLSGTLNFPADLDNNGAVTLKELGLYVTHTVKKLTAGRQRPTTHIPAHLPDFPLFLR